MRAHTQKNKIRRSGDNRIHIAKGSGKEYISSLKRIIEICSKRRKRDSGLSLYEDEHFVSFSMLFILCCLLFLSLPFSFLHIFSACCSMFSLLLVLYLCLQQPPDAAINIFYSSFTSALFDLVCFDRSNTLSCIPTSSLYTFFSPVFYLFFFPLFSSLNVILSKTKRHQFLIFFPSNQSNKNMCINNLQKGINVRQRGREECAARVKKKRE